jgi:hypothetical protein
MTDGTLISLYMINHLRLTEIRVYMVYCGKDKTKYIVISRNQNAEQSRSRKIDNSYCEGVAEFKYLETTLNQNSILEESRSK